jgi:aspartyl-tRNA(Asn)/glutamyl-tRNA(Gln) amidotransferase subunit A
MKQPGALVRDSVESVRRGDLSATELVGSALDKIREGDGSVRAFISVQADRALERARAIDALAPALKRDLPLCGIPVAVKDNICTRDAPTTCASRMLSTYVSPYSAAVVEAVEKAGAVIVGKTNLDEFAMGSSTETSVVGPTRNPVDGRYIAGGSSGGSAAAVAAGFVPLALGSDTGGSIRQPCSHCGAAGLKPTYGRVSRYGLVAFASSLDQIGPIAADVRDLGLLLEVIAAPDPRDSTCAGRLFRDEPGLYGNAIAGMRIGVPLEYFGEGLTEPVRRAVRDVIDRLADAGAIVTEVSLPHVGYAIAAYYIICTAEASSNLARYDGVKFGFRAPNPRDLREMYAETRRQGFGAEVKRRIMLGTYVLSSGYYDAYYLKAARVRTLIARDFEAAFQGCDAIVSPVAPSAAFRIGEKCDDPLRMYLTDIYTVSANLAGIPAISVPCGTDGILPIGVQFMAPRWREDTLLKLGFATQCMAGE